MNVWTWLVEHLNLEALLTQAVAWVPGAIAATVLLVGFVVVAFVLKRALALVFTRAGLDPTAAAFVQTMVRATLLTVGVLTALAQLGVDTTGLLTSLGVLGLTLGFAAQNTLSNVISGLFIFWDRPFVLGDLVEVDGVYGRVDLITLRSTRVVTPDGKMFAIPNTVVAGAKVASYTNFPHLRIDVGVTVGVNEDLGRCREILLGLVKGAAWMTTPEPVVVVTDLGDYNVTLELRAWLADEKTHVAVRMALREAIFEAFREAGVDMPYQTLALTPVEVRTAG